MCVAVFIGALCAPSPASARDAWAARRGHDIRPALPRTAAPSIAIHPGKAFVDGEFAFVAGTGFAPFRAVQWFQCALNQFCDIATVGNSVTQSDGSFSAVWGVHRDIVDGSRRINCSIESCFVYAVEIPSLAAATAPISFLPGSRLYSVKVRTLSSATIDQSGTIGVKLAVECRPFADLSVDVRVEQRPPNGGRSATGTATYYNFSCLGGPRVIRTIPVQAIQQRGPFTAGPATAYITVRLLGFGYGQQRSERVRIAIS